jgi:hypothetical protein
MVGFCLEIDQGTWLHERLHGLASAARGWEQVLDFGELLIYRILSIMLLTKGGHAGGSWEKFEHGGVLTSLLSSSSCAPVSALRHV